MEIGRNTIRLDAGFCSRKEEVDKFVSSYLWKRITELLDNYNKNLVGRNFPKVHLDVYNTSDTTAQIVLVLDNSKKSKMKILRNRIGSAIINLGRKIRGNKL